MSRRKSLGEAAISGRRARYDHDYRAELEACIRQTDFLLRRSVRGYLMPRRQSIGPKVEDQEFPHVKFDLSRKRERQNPDAPASIRDANKTMRPGRKPEFEIEKRPETTEIPGTRAAEKRVEIGETIRKRQAEETIEEIFSSEVAVPAKPRFPITDEVAGREEEDASYSEQDDFHFVNPEPMSSSSGTSAAFTYPRIPWMKSMSESESESEKRSESESESVIGEIPVTDIDTGPASYESDKKRTIKKVSSVLFKTFNTSDEDANAHVTGDLFGDSSSSSDLSSTAKRSVSESRSEPSFPKMVPSPSFDEN